MRKSTRTPNESHVHADLFAGVMRRVDVIPHCGVAQIQAGYRSSYQKRRAVTRYLNHAQGTWRLILSPFIVSVNYLCTA